MMNIKILLLPAFLLINSAAFGQAGGASGAIGVKSKDCSDFGLCRVETSNPGLTKMNFRYDVEKETLTFSFNEEDLAKTQPEKIGMLRGKKTFFQEEEVELPRSLSQQLGSMLPIRIPRGHHQLYYNNGIFTVMAKIN